jgi:hypothetical protein
VQLGTTLRPEQEELRANGPLGGRAGGQAGRSFDSCATHRARHHSLNCSKLISSAANPSASDSGCRRQVAIQSKSLYAAGTSSVVEQTS